VTGLEFSRLPGDGASPISSTNALQHNGWQPLYSCACFHAKVLRVAIVGRGAGMRRRSRSRRDAFSAFDRGPLAGHGRLWIAGLANRQRVAAAARGAELKSASVAVPGGGQRAFAQLTGPLRFECRAASAGGFEIGIN